MLEIAVLGAVEVRRDGGTVPVPGGRTTELLVRLALEAGTPVRVDRLVEDLWGEQAGATRRNTLQSKVARLRKALGDQGALVATDAGYVLAVERGDVDALAVIDDAATAAGLLAAGDERGAAECATQALARYRGELLGAAGAGDWVGPHRARLEAAHASLLGTRFAALVQLDEPGDLVGELEVAVAAHPFHERLWALLVTALYRAGRPADALAAHQRARAHLADELGLEPGPELRRLEDQILRHDPALAPRDASMATDVARPAGNLPSLWPELIGRDDDHALVGALVGQHRLVTIVGPGGVGKTTLAVAVARALEPTGGAWLVRLETTHTAAEMIDAVIAALDVTGDERALVARLRALDRPLLILDNAEHVLDDTAALALRLLDAAPGLRLLCTSQAPLGLDGERLVDLAPLAPADAVALFEARARAHRRGRDPSVPDVAVQELCAALDGLPLAIELAAARTRTLSTEEIARRLDDRFELLHDPSSRKPVRRRALGAAIAWSYELLFPDDQRGLWALAPFAGGASLPAVEEVLVALGVPRTATLDVLDRLVTRSLVIVDDGSPPRYRLLESIRAFALDALTQASAAEPAFAAHAAWLTEAAGPSSAGVRSGEQAAHLRFARTERTNIDAALAWCAGHDPRRGLTIATGFGWAWVVLGDSRGAQRVLAALHAAGPDADADERADALLRAGWMEASLGEVAGARAHIDAALAIADEIGDDALRARGAYHLAYVLSHDGDFRAALALTDRSRAFYARHDHPWDRAANALFALRAAISAGDHERSIEAAAHADDALAAVDDPWLHVRHEAMRGELARLHLRFDDAVAHLARAAATSARLGFAQTEAYHVASLGRAQCQAGDQRTGAATLALAVHKAEAVGDVRMAALARVHLGRVRRGLGDHAGARAALEPAVAWHRETGDGEEALLGDGLLAALDAPEGRAGAKARLQTVLAEARSTGVHPHVEVFALDALGRLAANAGDGAEARAHWAEADERMHAASHFISDHDRADRR